MTRLWARFRSPRQASRRAALRELIRAFPGRTAALALLALLSGALPAVFAALVGLLIGVLPAVVRVGFDSPAGHRAIGALGAIAVVLILIEAAGGAKDVVSTDLYRRFDGYLLGRVMSAALAREDLRLFDDPPLAASLDRGVQLARYGPGELVSGLNTQWTVRCQGLAAAVLVGRLLAGRGRRADRTLAGRRALPAGELLPGRPVLDRSTAPGPLPRAHRAAAAVGEGSTHLRPGELARRAVRPGVDGGDDRALASAAGRLPVDGRARLRRPRCARRGLAAAREVGEYRGAPAVRPRGHTSGAVRHAADREPGR